MNFGDLKILLPPKVDTTVTAKLNAGDAKVFGSRWGGFGTQRRDVADKGSDGTGGGTLLLNITLNAGDLEVHR
jgi:predicted membrane protein